MYRLSFGRFKDVICWHFVRFVFMIPLDFQNNSVKVFNGLMIRQTKRWNTKMRHIELRKVELIVQFVVLQLNAF